MSWTNTVEDSTAASKVKSLATRYGTGKFIHMISLAAGLSTLLGGLFMFFSLGFTTIICGTFTMLFGAFLLLTELYRIPSLDDNVQFLSSFLGRGIIYTYVGFNILADWGILTGIFGILAALIGVCFIVFHFVNRGRIPFPPSMFNKAVVLPTYLVPEHAQQQGYAYIEHQHLAPHIETQPLHSVSSSQLPPVPSTASTQYAPVPTSPTLTAANQQYTPANVSYFTAGAAGTVPPNSGYANPTQPAYAPATPLRQ